MIKFGKMINNLLRGKSLWVSHQRKNPARANDKWRLINDHLPKEPGSLLDIGCNEGLFTKNAALKGWCAWGIDILDRAVNYAKKSADKEGIQNVFFSYGTLAPDVAQCLPKFDVIILASTFQEICSTFGLEKGYDILYNLLKASNKKLFFEPSSLNAKYGPDALIFEHDNDLESVDKWLKKLVSRLPEWEVRYIGKTHCSAKEPYRFMFLFEKK
jgi:SAM-dependent methyltransferase